MSDKKVVSPPGSAAFRSSYAIVDATSAPKIASNCVSTSSADSDANRVLMSALAVAISAVGSDRNPDMTEQSLGWCRRAGAVIPSLRNPVNCAWPQPELDFGFKMAKSCGQKLWRAYPVYTSRNTMWRTFKFNITSAGPRLTNCMREVNRVYKLEKPSRRPFKP